MKAFFDRKKGLFTLQDVDKKGNIIKIFDRLAARSGAKGYESTNWVTGKSPVPWGKHRLWLNSINVGTKPGAKGIGEFFHISDGDNPLIITNGTQKRSAIGLHAENAIPGSAGCIVIVKQDKFTALAEYLRKLGKKDKWIELEVL